MIAMPILRLATLLQRLEDYEGLVILATNMRNNLDSAFVRRMAFIVQFPQPEEGDRLRIWQSDLAVGSAVCVRTSTLRSWRGQFKFSGGNIKNIAMAAAFLSRRQRPGCHHAAPDLGHSPRAAEDGQDGCTT